MFFPIQLLIGTQEKKTIKTVKYPLICQYLEYSLDLSIVELLSIISFKFLISQYPQPQNLASIAQPMRSFSRQKQRCENPVQLAQGIPTQRKKSVDCHDHKTTILRFPIKLLNKSQPSYSFTSPERKAKQNSYSRQMQPKIGERAQNVYEGPLNAF